MSLCAKSSLTIKLKIGIIFVGMLQREVFLALGHIVILQAVSEFRLKWNTGLLTNIKIISEYICVCV